MGNAIYNHSPAVFGATEFAWWSLGHVKGAAARSRMFRDAEGDILLNRKQFWEVFTDYTLIRDSSFLALPIEYFDAYAANGTVDAHVLLIIMTLFCAAPLKDQLKAIFALMDSDDHGVLDQGGVKHLCRTVLRALKVADVLVSTGPATDVDAIVLQLFQELHESSVDAEEFSRWCRVHPSCNRLIEQVDKARTSSARTVNRNLIKSLSAAPDPGASAAAARQAGKQELDNLVASTKLSVAELRRIRSHFQQAAGDTMQLDKFAFGNVLAAEFEHLVPPEDVDRMFDVFDEDGSGFVDFKEFVIGISKLLQGSVEDKLELLLECVDTNSTGQLPTSELLRFVHASSESVLDKAAATSQKLAMLDTAGKGIISTDGLLYAMISDGQVFESLMSSIMPSVPHVASILSRMMQAGCAIRLDGLLRFAENRVTLSTNPYEYSQFKQMMLETCAITQDGALFLQRLFDQLPKVHMDAIHIQHAIAVLHCALATTNDERAKSLVQWFDFAGSRTVQVQQIQNALAGHRDKIIRSAAELSKLIGLMDVDHDGAVSATEFRSMARSDTKVVKCFCTLFGVATTSTDGHHLADRRERAVSSICRLLLGADTPGDGSGPGGSVATKKSAALERLRRQSLATSVGVLTELQRQEAVAAATGKGQQQPLTSPTAAPSVGGTGANNSSTGSPTGASAAGARPVVSVASVAAKEHGRALSRMLTASAKQLRQELHTPIPSLSVKSPRPITLVPVTPKPSAGSTLADLTVVPETPKRLPPSLSTSNLLPLHQQPSSGRLLTARPSSSPSSFFVTHTSAASSTSLRRPATASPATRRRSPSPPGSLFVTPATKPASAPVRVRAASAGPSRPKPVMDLQQVLAKAQPSPIVRGDQVLSPHAASFLQSAVEKQQQVLRKRLQRGTTRSMTMAMRGATGSMASPTCVEDILHGSPGTRNKYRNPPKAACDWFPT